MRCQLKSLALLFILMPLLEGCASFGEGVVQGLLEDAEEKDTRACQIWSKGFSGIDASIDRKEGTTKRRMDGPRNDPIYQVLCAWF